MGFLKRLFGSAVEQAQEFDAAMASCQFESSNKDCSLVQNMKDKQAAKREIDGRIKSYNDHSADTIIQFFSLLVEMEKSGFKMGDHDWRMSYGYGSSNRSFITESFERAYGVIRLEEILDRMPEEGVAAIGTELTAMKQRATILGDLRRQSAELGKEIETIKTQLGIE